MSSALNPHEIELLREIGTKPRLGVVGNGLTFSPTSDNLAADISIRQRLFRAAAQGKAHAQVRYWAHLVYNVWFGGFSDTEIGNALGFSGAQVDRHKKNGMPFDVLIVAMLYTDHARGPIPEPPNDYNWRYCYMAGIHDLLRLFREAGITDDCLDVAPPANWEMELFLQTSGLILALKEEDTLRRHRIADEAISRTIATLQSECHALRITTTDEGLRELRALATQPDSALQRVTKTYTDLGCLFIMVDRAFRVEPA